MSLPDPADVYTTDVELARRYAVARVTIWRWAGNAEFPAPIRLGPNCSRWRMSDVLAWERSRLGEDRTDAATRTEATRENGKKK